MATGTNADDARAGFRPGIAAASERGAVTPLLDAGLTKAQVRAASRAWDLPTWDKPAAACLSSRVAYGIEITPSRLARVERAEADLREALVDAGHAVRDLRVRDLGDAARVEVDRDLVDAAAGLLDVVRGAGFDDGRGRPAGLPVGVDERAAPRPGALPLTAGGELRGGSATAYAVQSLRRPSARRPTDRPRRRRRRPSAVPTGKVKWYDAEKGFGFLSREDGDDVYVRSSSLPEGVTTLKAGTRVEFGVLSGRKGEQAHQVRVLDAPPSVSHNQRAAQRRKPEDMVGIVEDLIRLLEGVGRRLPRTAGTPTPRPREPTAKLLRGLADELDL